MGQGHIANHRLRRESAGNTLFRSAHACLNHSQFNFPACRMELLYNNAPVSTLSPPKDLLNALIAKLSYDYSFCQSTLRENQKPFYLLSYCTRTYCFESWGHQASKIIYCLYYSMNSVDIGVSWSLNCIDLIPIMTRQQVIMKSRVRSVVRHKWVCCRFLIQNLELKADCKLNTRAQVYA